MASNGTVFWTAQTALPNSFELQFRGPENETILEPFWTTLECTSTVRKKNKNANLGRKIGLENGLKNWTAKIEPRNRKKVEKRIAFFQGNPWKLRGCVFEEKPGTRELEIDSILIKSLPESGPDLAQPAGSSKLIAF